MKLSRSEKIKNTYNQLNKDTMYLVEEFYAPEVVFEDPIHRVEGREQLKEYYKGLYKTVRNIQFDIYDEVVQGSKHVIFWNMNLEVPSLNSGRPYKTKGSSLLEFNENDQVIYHCDYFDMGEFIYEQIPVVKHLVKAIRQRLSK